MTSVKEQRVRYADVLRRAALLNADLVERNPTDAFAVDTQALLALVQLCETCERIPSYAGDDVVAAIASGFTFVPSAPPSPVPPSDAGGP